MTRTAGTAGDREPIRRSVEVEYWVIDGTGRLADPGDLVDLPGAEREFVVPMLEIKTTPCETTAELRAELFERVGDVLERADERDLGLVPLSTPIAADSIRDLPSERTRIQDRVVGEPFEYVRRCAGTHIHVEQHSGCAVDQLNMLTALDPALALVNSSPYFEGERLARGARSLLYRRMAYDDLPHQGQLWPYVDDTEEWAERLERRYAEFKTAATIAGIDSDAVESAFEPESAVWTPVKLRAEFSTVEWRSPDTALPSQVVRLADDIVGVVERTTEIKPQIAGTAGHLADDAIVLPEFEALKEYVDTAIRDGLADESLRAYLDRMGFDVSAYDPLAADIGGSEELSPARARDLRLEYAARLEDDIREAHKIHAD
ncbi:MAG: carboxylate-amine ligase [Natronomonas sp.]|jgi:gamma-glutamyl:cysteine ligase YbdK (ATP-grasp superfamily)|uniref:glutamate-cysteine ligase family protein n=1 Tax=Natronomonas sp. TaxID=2184060 RepID=UPI00398967C6